MLGIGDKFPEFSLTALVPGDLSALDAKTPDDYFTKIDSSTYEGKWRVVFFWPKDFTFVCPTEIAEFGRLNGEFADRDAQVLGGSVDNEYVHYAWRIQHEDLLGLPFPMLADLNRALVSDLGVLNSDRTASSSSPWSPPARSAGTSKRCSVCWTRCRPTSCAPATGTRVRRRSTRRRS
jgi:alkyl hydroperoxide reductase subunit AhpC